MKLLAAGSTGEIVEKKSRFIATCIPVTSEEEARDFVSSIKKQYHDARHNCYAYVIGENNELTKSSDDKEPSGTAGRPILDTLIHSGIHNICMVVTRYFGGVLLGTGGLIRAYTDASKAALFNAQIKEEICGIKVGVDTDYNGYGRISYYLESEGIPVLTSEFSDRVSLLIFVQKDKMPSVTRELTEMTGGKVDIKIIQEPYFMELSCDLKRAPIE